MKYLPHFSVLPLLVLLLSACATPKSDDYTKYRTGNRAADISDKTIMVYLDEAGLVDFRALYDADNSTGAGPMMYSGAAGAGGMLAQIVTHAAISSSMQNGKLSEQQVKANKILEPLRPTLQEFHQKSLMHSGSGFDFSGEDTTGDGLVMDSHPIFFLSKDARFISLKHIVVVHKKNNKNILYQNLLEVISPKISGDAPLTTLQQNGGAVLRNVAENLYQYSLVLAVADFNGKYAHSEAPQRSITFHQGDEVRVERGTDIGQDCDTAIARNLRGWLIAYPLSEAGQSTVGCQHN